MSTIYEYAEGQCVKTFDEAPLNEVDNVIFSRLAYLNFIGLNGKTFSEAAGIFPRIEKEDINARNRAVAKTVDMLITLGSTERYKNVVIEDFEDIAGGTYETAFSAVTFKISENIHYIAYRGTDEQILGFYEDAELAYSFPVKAQLAALSYTNRVFDRHEGRFYLGGHSKGGNLAVFSFIFTKYENKERTVLVYNNDGPGFPENLADDLFTPSNCLKILNISPESSIVGRMLATKCDYIIVKSNATGIAQHNVFTWLTNGAEFEKAEKFSPLSEYLEDTFTESLAELPPDVMKKTVKSIYSIAKKSGIETLDDINKAKLLAVLTTILERRKNEDGVSDEVNEILKTLAKSLIDSIDVFKYVPDPDFRSMYENIRTRLIEKTSGKNDETADEIK